MLSIARDRKNFLMEGRMACWTAVGLAGFAAMLGACRGDLLAPNRGQPTMQGTARSARIATFSVIPHQVTVGQGYLSRLLASEFDLRGARLAKPVTWRSTDSSVVVVNDTGIVYARTLGTAIIYASIDGFSDSSVVTVVPPPDVAPPPPAAPVSEFSLSVTAVGVVGADTSKTQHLPGATVTLERVAGTGGDTLEVPVDAGSAVTDEKGEARFSRVPGGSYRIRVTPAPSSPYLPSETNVAAPRSPNVFVYVALPGKQ